MEDNGLLKYYPEYSNNEGYLKINELCNLRFSMHEDVKQGVLSGLKFYTKFNREYAMDAEILLSQIAYLLGLETAIYLPCVDKRGRYGVVSDDVKKHGTMTMRQYSNIMKLKHSSYKSPYANNCLETRDLNLDKFFSKEAIVNYIGMHYFDVFTCNVDRHDENFFVDTKFDFPSKLLTVQGLKLIDYGISRSYVGLEDIYGYYNGLGGGNDLNALELIEKLKTDEFILQYVSPVDMAEKFGNFNVKSVVEDIENTTGYDIAKNYTIGLQDRFYSLAEELVK